MADFLERVRSLHEDVERLEQALVELLMEEPRGHRQRLRQQHQARELLDLMAKRQSQLADIYEDKDGSRKDALQSLAIEGPELLASFANQVREIKTYHRQHPRAPLVQESFAIGEPKAEFTGEENNGRCVDLHAFYSRYLNLAYGKKYFPRDATTGESSLSYVKFLETFYKFGDDLSVKDAQYLKYLEDLWEYLRHFVERTQPLHPINSEIDGLLRTFDSLWESGDFQWDHQPISLPDGHEFCPILRKVFTNKNVFAARLKGKRYIRALKQAEAQGGAGKQEARLEYLINKLCESLLADTLVATKRQVQKKQSLSYEEWQKELEEQAMLDAGEDALADDDEDMDSEDEAELVRGIKDYPVDWEGKPIPYWLYKLHGLGVSYYCEISGGVYYKGYRAFQRHFDEPPYLEGLRRLGIPSRYHKYFFGITRIADATKLWSKLKKDESKTEWIPEDMVEEEDDEGNVYNHKLYLDLKRQGLITPSGAN